MPYCSKQIQQIFSSLVPKHSFGAIEYEKLMNIFSLVLNENYPLAFKETKYLNTHNEKSIALKAFCFAPSSKLRILFRTFEFSDYNFSLNIKIIDECFDLLQTYNSNFCIDSQIFLLMQSPFLTIAQHLQFLEKIHFDKHKIDYDMLTSSVLALSDKNLAHALAIKLNNGHLWSAVASQAIYMNKIEDLEFLLSHNLLDKTKNYNLNCFELGTVKWLHQNDFNVLGNNFESFTNLIVQHEAKQDLFDFYLNLEIPMKKIEDFVQYNIAKVDDYCFIKLTENGLELKSYPQAFLDALQSRNDQSQKVEYLFKKCQSELTQEVLDEALVWVAVNYHCFSHFAQILIEKGATLVKFPTNLEDEDNEYYISKQAFEEIKKIYAIHTDYCQLNEQLSSKKIANKTLKV